MTSFQPLRGHRFHQYTDAMLAYIIRDASEARACAQGMQDARGEGKYADQVNDACTIRAYRRRQQEAKQGRYRT
jgi:hypothetical protein